MIKQKRHAFFQIFFFLAVQLIVFLGFSKTAHADVTKTITFEIRNLGNNASIIPTHVNDRNGNQTPLGTCTSGNIATYNWTTRAGTVIGSITVDMTTSGKATIKLSGVSVDNGNTPYFYINGGTKTGYHPSGWVPNTPTHSAGLSSGIDPNYTYGNTFNADGTCFFYSGAAFNKQYEEIHRLFLTTLFQ